MGGVLQLSKKNKLTVNIKQKQFVLVYYLNRCPRKLVVDELRTETLVISVKRKESSGRQ